MRHRNMSPVGASAESGKQRTNLDPKRTSIIASRECSAIGCPLRSRR
jgi:hypothetical protein